MPREISASVALTTATLRYQLLRNTTSPDEKVTGVQSFVANLSAFEIMSLDTRENLRSYIAEHNPKRRNKVHDAIRSTIMTEPNRFITRNGGFVIGASNIEVDDAAKTVKLQNASIMNGAQSQGEIKRWVSEMYGDDFVPNGEEVPFYVRAEIIVDPDEAEIVETAIARNTATQVKSISQAGARGQLEDLERSIQRLRPSAKIQKRETDVDALDTRKILQIARLLMPVEVSKNNSASEKLRAYKMAEQCLTEFSDWYDRRAVDPEAKLKYDFTVAIAPYALAEYEYWERHPAWNGQRVWEENRKGRACRRDRSGRIVWVSPGLVFPIMGAISEFVVEKAPGVWEIDKPDLFQPDEMIASAVKQFRSVDSDPMLMGRSAGAYDALRIYPATLMQVMKAVQKAATV
jgi:hypothetical protein